MAVDDFGIEVLKKAAEEVTPGNKSNYYLKVRDSELNSVVPLESTVINFSQALQTSAASELMNVDGSVTPVNFDLTPSIGQTFYVYGVSIFIQHKGSTDSEKFGALTQLTNGVRMLCSMAGTDYEMFNIRTNVKLGAVFSRGAMIPAAGNGWYNDNDTYQGLWEFNQPITLKNSRSDRMRVVIRDDLSVINNFRMVAKYYRVT